MEKKRKVEKIISEYMSDIGKRGGSSKSRAKQEAARRNGKIAAEKKKLTK